MRVAAIDMYHIDVTVYCTEKPYIAASTTPARRRHRPSGRRLLLCHLSGAHVLSLDPLNNIVQHTKQEEQQPRWYSQ
jgi:hypothetical protein